MNVPDTYDNMTSRRPPPRSAIGGSGHYIEASAPPADDADDTQRRGWIMALISLLLAVGFVAVFFLGSATHRIKIAPVADLPTPSAMTSDEHLTLGMMLAPGTTVGTRVAGTPGAVAGDVMMALPPAESPADFADELSPEWQLAMSPPAPTPAPASQTTDEAQPVATSRSVARPEPARTTTNSKTPMTVAAESRLSNGITMRVYRSEPMQTRELRAYLAEELKACRSQGFIAGEACRYQVCNPYWGKLPECPYQDPVSN